jgi:hypothetical protein
MALWQQALGALLLISGQGALADPAPIATPIATPIIVAAEYTEPTTRYDHGILGDAVEWAALSLRVKNCATCPAGGHGRVLIRLPDFRVFEDVAPRLLALDAGPPKVVVVESDLNQGARLAVYDETGLVTATPFIGRRNRWLAPVGAADLDRDGLVELAYIDRPHLARILKIWRYKDGTLSAVAQLKGLTNHRIGENDIAGGIRTCKGQPEMILASADWTRLIAVRLDQGQLQKRDLGPHKDRSSFAAALLCS